MSFSHEMKLELTEYKTLRTRWKNPHAYGILLFAKRFDRQKVLLHTEVPEVADLLEWLVKSLLGRNTRVERGELSGRGKPVYTVTVAAGEDCARLAELLGHREGSLERGLLTGQDEQAAFLAGAFLACGNVTDPAKGYHIEFVVRDPALAEPLFDLLEEVLPGVKKTVRRKAQVLYYKECAQIEDLMTLMGASKSCLAMIEVEMIKSVRNRANRATNCETANIDKLVNAAAAQMEDIRLVLEQEANLPEGLLQVARLRMDNPEASLRELADLSPVPISRSGVHHRLDKLSKMAQRLRVKKQGS